MTKHQVGGARESIQCKTTLYISVSLSTGKYINASNIELNGKSFIATQGPKPNTINDFWQLISDQKIETVVSLCQMCQSGDFSSPRCFDYLSEFGKKDFEIIEDNKNYVIRRIKSERNDLKLDFTHVSTSKSRTLLYGERNPD